MQIRADLSQPARVLPEDWAWVESPQQGVTRVMLDRDGEEVAVATSLVRYAPDSRFPGHHHAKGEEFIVLEGEFADEHGRFPPGSYVRNPPGSQHVPFSDPGCLIWVKLRQFQPDDLTPLTLTLDQAIPEQGECVRVLHEYGEEQVAEITAAAGARVIRQAALVPQELLVLAGEIDIHAPGLPGGPVGPMGWARLPAGSGFEFTARTPCRVFWKTRPGMSPEGDQSG